MPLSRCYHTIRQYEHRDFWAFSSGYLAVYCVFAAMSTIILYYGGSARPRRLVAWLAKWTCLKGCFNTFIVEVIASFLFIMVLGPPVVIVIWVSRAYQYEYSYSGTEEPDMVGSYDHCKTLAATVFFMMISFESMRAGLFMWRFRAWVVVRTTFYVIGISCLAFLLYIFMLTQTVETNDDIMNAVVFLSLSALPLVRVLYNYYDDLSLDLNDYLYGSAGQNAAPALSKGSRWSPWERRWNFLRYFSHIAVSLVLYSIYAFAGLWLEERPSSPGYVLPYVIIVDLGLLANLHSATGRNFSEVVFSFLTMLTTRVVVLFLAWQDRSSSKPGAYEFVEPTFFLLIMIVLCKAYSDSYWTLAKKNPEEVIADDRYYEWIQRQRELIVHMRNTDGGKDEPTLSFKFASCFRDLLFKCGKLVSFKTNPADKTSFQINAEQISRCMFQLTQIKLQKIDLAKEIYSGIFRIDEICDVERLYASPDPDDKLQTYTRGPKTGQAKKVNTSNAFPDRSVNPSRFLKAEDVAISQAELERQDQLAADLTKQVWKLKLYKFVHSFKMIWFFFLLHTIHGVLFWFIREPLDRLIWPFDVTVRQTNAYWAVLVLAVGFHIWTFVYGGLASYRSMAEDQDEARLQFRTLMHDKNSQMPNLSRDRTTRFLAKDTKDALPEPLSFQHFVCRAAVVELCDGPLDAPPVDINTAVATALNKCASAENLPGLLQPERPKVAAEAATMANLTRFTAFLHKYEQEHAALPYEEFLAVVSSLNFAFGSHSKESEAESRYKYFVGQANAELTEQGEALDPKAVAAIAGRKMMSYVAGCIIEETASWAQKVSQDQGATHREEIASVILSSAWCHTYLKSWKVHPFGGDSRVLSLPDCLTEAASRASKYVIGVKRTLTIDQKKAAAHGPAAYLGSAREREIVSIAADTKRLPEFCMTGLMLPILESAHAAEEETMYCLLLSAAGALCGLVVTGFLIMIDGLNPSQNEWLGSTPAGQDQLVILSIFVPLTMLPFFAVFRSWQRNNYYLFCNTSSVENFGTFYTEYRSGLMRPRDTSNTHFMIFGLVNLIAWCITNWVVLTALEGFALAIAFVALMTTWLPATRANVHRLAQNFYHQGCINGFILVVILNAIYWALEGDYILVTLSGAYYMFFTFALVVLRRNMDDYMKFPLFREADKIWIFPLGFMLLGIYRWYVKVHGSSEKSTIAAILTIGCVLCLLLGLFFLVVRRLSDANVQSHAESKELHEREGLKAYLNITQENAIASDVSEVEEDTDGLEELDCCQRFVNYIQTHWEWITLISIYCVLCFSTCLGMGLWMHSRSEGYSTSQYSYAIITAFLLVNFVLFMGGGLTAGHGGWATSSELILPVMVPAKSKKIAGEFDFAETLVPDNIPAQFMIAAGLIALFWGMLSTICPDVSMLLNTNQMAIGVATISAVVVSGVTYPLFIKLKLCYAVQKNFTYVVEKPITLTPLELIERSCMEEFEELVKKSTDTVAEFGMEEPDFLTDVLTPDMVKKLCVGVWGDVFSNAIPGQAANSTVQNYKQANNPSNSQNNPENVFLEPRFTSGLQKMFAKFKDEPAEDQVARYSFYECFLFLKRHCLKFGELTYDDKFLSEKRQQAIRELRCFRLAQTACCLIDKDQDSYTAARLQDKIENRLYPEALHTLQLCGNCYSAPEGADPDPDRRILFDNLYTEEFHNVTLEYEKIRLEGHFLLTVAVNADFNARVDQIAFYLLQSGNAFKATEEEHDEDESEEAKKVLPLVAFNDPRATAAYKPALDSIYPPSGYNGMWLARNADWHSLANEKNLAEDQRTCSPECLEYAERVIQACERGGEVITRNVTLHLGEMYKGMKLISEYYALRCAPASIKARIFRDRGMKLEKDSGVTIISEESWMLIFGRVGSPKTGSGEVTTTVVDLYESLHRMHEAWELYMNCWDKLAAPVEYGSALMLEFLESDLVSSWIATASSRYNLLKELLGESVGFRVYIENMTSRAKDDAVTQSDDCMKQFVMFSQKLGELKGTFMKTAVKMMPQSEHCAEPAGEAEPWYGPAILREAALVFKGRAFLEVIFDHLMQGQNGVLSLQAIQEWGDRLNHSNPGLWTFPHPQDGKPTHRFSAFREKGGYTKEEFAQHFQVLVLYHTVTKWHSGTDFSGLLTPCKDRGEFGMLCGVQNDSFDWSVAEEVFEAIVEDWVHTTSSTSADFESKARDTVNKDWAVLSDYASMLEEMFDNCFHNHTPSFQWRLDRHQDAFRAPLSAGYFRDCVSRIQEIINSPPVQKCDKMGLFRKGLGPKGFFGQMLVLFDCDPVYRSGFASAYRCARLYEHAVKAGNESSGENKKQLTMIHKISDLLRGVLGDNGDEERRIKDATDIVWFSDSVQEQHDALVADIAEDENRLQALQKRAGSKGHPEIEPLMASLEQSKSKLSDLACLLSQDWKIKLVKQPQQLEPSGQAPKCDDSMVIPTSPEHSQSVGLQDIVVVDAPAPAESAAEAPTGAGGVGASQKFSLINVNVFLLDNMLVAMSPVKIKFEPDRFSTGVQALSRPTSPTQAPNARLTRSMSHLLDEDTYIEVSVMQTALLSGAHCPLLDVSWVWLPELDPCDDRPNRYFVGEGTPNAISVKGIRERDIGHLEETYYFTAAQESSDMLEDLYAALKTCVVEEETVAQIQPPATKVPFAPA